MKIRVVALVVALSSWVAAPLAAETLNLPGLSAPAQLHTDALGVPHIVAATLEDAYRVQGWVHARDRFFQMDLLRRTADGRRAELTGILLDAIQDGATRPVGLRAATEREGELLSSGERALVQAYADGVNAWLATHPLPDEYGDLEVGSVPAWAALDALMIAKAAFFAFDVPFCGGTLPCDVSDTRDLLSFEAAGDAQGFDGHALFVEDHFRVAPIEPAATVPDAGGVPPYVACTPPAPLASAAEPRVRVPVRGAPRLQPGETRGQRSHGGGSNAFAVAASQAAAASPLLATDGHGPVEAPSLTYEVQLRVTGDPVYGALNISGTSLPGVAGIFNSGQTDHVAWAVTDFEPDVGDVFADRLLRGAPGCPSRLCIESEGELHPVVERQERYFQNDIADGMVDTRTEVSFLPVLALHALTVPFRGHGPVIQIDDATVLDPGTSPAETTIQTLQYTGLHGSYIARGVVGMMTATDVAEFGAALRDLATASENFVVSDVSGALAYFTSGEVPLRADLEAGALVGLEPRFVRDGSGPNNWIADPNRVDGQVLPYRVIPPEEMPQVVDPPAGYVVNANNDPSGAELDNDLLNQCRPSSPSSIYYLGPHYELGLRAGRITRLIQAELGGPGSVSLSEMQAFMGNTQQLDAELMVPFVVDALANAQLPGAPPSLAALAADAGIADLVSRLAAWDFSTPTGIPEGYDGADVDGVLDPTVSPAEAAASVAATLYNVWRAEVVEAVVVARLGDLGLAQVYDGASFSHFHHLLSRTPFTGVGASGVDFFPEPSALTAAERRDTALLAAARATLDRLASGAFADAFANSTDPDDYRWGRLNRISLPHPLGGDRSVPPAAGFVDLAPGLPGIPRDGAWQTVNIGLGFGALARLPEQFESDYLSWYRRVLSPGHPDALPDPVLGMTSVPGGASGDYLSPFYMNQLPEWLTVDQHPVVVNENEISAFPSEPAVAAAVSKGQQSCVTELNNRGAAVGKAQGKETSSCLKQAAKGKETDPQTCLTADAKGKVAKAQEKALKGEQKKCGERPFFGYGGAQAASDAGEGGSLALTEDLFGADLNGVVLGKSSDKSGAACQAQLQKSAQKALETVWKEAGKAAKGALAGKQGAEPAESGTELQDALAAVFGPSDKVEKALGKIESGGAKKCGGLSDLAAAAPGACADADVAEVTGCLRERALCRACRSVNAMEALALPCDSLDDGAVNDSC